MQFDNPPRALEASLAVFAPTADQRYMLGRDVFLRTHSPITMRRFRNGVPSLEVGEDKLLEQLLDAPDRPVGNRVYILYAAPGSGKSEVMRWLATQIEAQAPARAEVTVRISRTELDALSISERFRYLLSADSFEEMTHQRWAAARQKPRTLSKLLVLSALESLLDSDEEINALFYRLLNAVQPYIERSLGSANEGSELIASNAELLSREEWEAIKTESSLTIPLEYEQFRRQMLVAFRHHLLEGLDLPDTLRRISGRVIQQHGLRPILLVDDLVQSLNLFATDLLDYFITLEEGNWDVVLGLTPAAFEVSQRGRDLLQRIAYLDTIDDRVEKLWLSDEAGHDSYVLTEANCHHFAARYLAEYRRLTGLSGRPELYPFDREALVRIYRGLPAGKGKARYFLRHLRLILAQVAQGEPLLSTVAQYARTESVARCTDPTLAAICELYGPLLPDGTVRSVTLPAALLAQFDLPAQEMTIAVEPLLKLKLHREAITQVIDDEEKAAVRDWLLGREVNRQLLHPLRQGLARLLRKVAPPHLIHRPGIAQPRGLLHWHKPYLNTQPPICLEDVDADGDGIPVGREVGLPAFDLHRYATATGAEARALEASLAGEAGLLPVFFAAGGYQRRMAAQLENELGLGLEELGLGLYAWGLVHFEASILEPVSPRTPLQNWLPGRSPVYLPVDEVQQAATWQEWQALFDDFFQLRENLYDGQRLRALGTGWLVADLFAALLSVDPARIDRSYRWGKRLLANALADWQVLIRHAAPVDAHSPLSPPAQHWLARLAQAGPDGLPLTNLPAEILAELARNAAAQPHHLRVRLGE